MTAISAPLARIFDDDLKFLKDNGRNFRARLASEAEIEESYGTSDKAPKAPDCVYVVVKQIKPGTLRRVCVVAPEGMPTDLTEEQAEALFEHLYEHAGMRPRPFVRMLH